MAQYSFDYADFDSNPFPGRSSDSHGTNVAGEIAMVRNNTICGVGVAYDSRIAGENCTSSQLRAIFIIVQDCDCLEAARLPMHWKLALYLTVRIISTFTVIVGDLLILEQ